MILHIGSVLVYSVNVGRMNSETKMGQSSSKYQQITSQEPSGQV